jgi:hypothetical protein
LAAEVAALDVARSALDLGLPGEALSLLGRYVRDFPKGRLMIEAEVMEIEALAESGERGRVASRASDFLERHPEAPQRDRVARLRSEATRE